MEFQQGNNFSVYGLRIDGSKRRFKAAASRRTPKAALTYFPPL